ncbi:MAG: hypothetical protein ACYDAN_10135, partial [Candidatus Limnocylindrales bacterium]
MSTRLGLAGAGLLVAGAVLVGAGSAFGGGVGNASMMGGATGADGGMMGGATGAAGGMMGGGVPGGMMGGGSGMMGGLAGASGPGPGEAGFVAGAQASPRVVRVIAGPGYAFTPSTITVAR